MLKCDRMLAVLSLIAVFTWVQPASGEERIIQPGPADGKDTYVNSYIPSSSHGSEDYLNFGGSLPSGEQRLYIQFDLSPLGGETTIDTAQLEVFMFSQNGFVDGYNYSVMQITGSWSESSLTWATQPTFDPLAITAFPGSEWQGAYGIWHSIGGLGELVQFWVDNPDQNFGMLIKPTSGSYGYPMLWSSDYGTANLRPKLVINGLLVPTEETNWGEIKLLY